MRKKRKQLSGGAKMRAAGKKPILLGVTVPQKMILQEAADIEMRPVAQFVTFHAMQAAKRILSCASPPKERHR